MGRFLFKIWLLVTIVFSVYGCKKLNDQHELIYINTFEDNNLANSSGLIINSYNGTKVAGFYNNGKFDIRLDNLKDHDFIKVSFDLYIHNYWDGNSTGNKEITTGPDTWSMKVDDSYIIRTTFSNTVCNVIYCLQQSYPNNYPFQNDPQTGASNTNLPGLCGNGGITTLYRVEKLVKHSGGRISVTFEDLLKQSNVDDKLCDESWSLDNLKISTLRTN